VRSLKTARLILPLLMLAVFWWLQPEAFGPFLHSGFVINVGSAEQPRELFVSTAAIVLVPIALRFGLPLILKAALLTPFAATALSHRVAQRGPTFDPARDLANNSSTPGSQEDAAIDKAIAAALAARAASADRPAFGKVEQASGAVAPAPARSTNRQDAAA
jgi:hypothetical protein